MIFLPHDQIPPNLLRLRPGDKVRVVTSRAFVRAGYRLRAADLYDEVEAALKDTRGAALRLAFHGLLSTLEPSKMPVETHVALLPYDAHRRLVHVLARELVKARRFGGPSRGVHVVPWVEDAVVNFRVARRRISDTLAPPGAELEVDHTYTVRVGVYYPPSYGAPPYYDDAEPGGLMHARTVIVAVLKDNYRSYPHVLSGDLARI